MKLQTQIQVKILEVMVTFKHGHLVTKGEWWRGFGTGKNEEK